jgi:hypothetical protein
MTSVDKSNAHNHAKVQIFSHRNFTGREPMAMSPFVVMVALSIWAALWGIPGAILAVSLTSVLLIVLAGFQASRPIAILLSNDVTAFRSKEE